MHSGDLTELEQASLTQQEKEALLEVMERAKDFDKKVQAKGRRGQALEGQLHKWTNPLKGWQPRWFVVDLQQSVLHYYTSEEKKKQAPRGSLHLWGAVVAPSDEDSQTFSINGANGEVYKLRAQGAKERQQWVSRLRREVENCTNQNYSLAGQDGLTMNSGVEGQTSPQHSVTTPTRALSKRLSKGWMRPSTTRQVSGSKGNATSSSTVAIETNGLQDELDSSTRGLDNFPGGDAMLEVLTRLQRLQGAFSSQLQTCVLGGDLSANDPNVLLSRATSQAALASVKDCLATMKNNLDSTQMPLERSPSTSPTHPISNHQGSSGPVELEDAS